MAVRSGRPQPSPRSTRRTAPELKLTASNSPSSNTPSACPPQTTTAALWLELGFTRISSTWLSRCIVFHNTALARRDPADLLKLALIENKQMAGQGTRCWSFYLDKVLRKQAAFPHSLSLNPIDADLMMAAYDTAWIDSLLAPSTRLPSHLSVRNMPDSASEGFKVLKYQRWFATASPPKDRFWHHAHNRHLIRTLARLRLAMLPLKCETGRRVNNQKVPRSARICPVCTSATIEDEWHLFCCPAYQDIRAAFPTLFTDQATMETLPDSDINDRMNPPASRWRQLGSYISSCLKERERLVNGAHRKAYSNQPKLAA